MLLHGLTASGDYFGRAFDEVADTVVVPDLPGFGRSAGRDAFDFQEYSCAINEVRDALAIEGAMLVCGHSMGALLAIRWAATRPNEVAGVVAWAPVLQRSRAAACRAIARLGLLERLFVLDTDRSRRACDWMCRHRTLAGLASVASAPHLPVRVALDAVQHTWPSYAGALEHLVLRSDVERSLEILDFADIPVHLVVGSRDALVDLSYAAELAVRYGSVRLRVVDGGHHLPLESPAPCLPVAPPDDT